MRILVTIIIGLAVGFLILAYAYEKMGIGGLFPEEQLTGTYQSPVYGTFSYRCSLIRERLEDPTDLKWIWSVTWKPTTSEGRNLLNRAYNIMRRYGDLKISGDTATVVESNSLIFWSGMLCLIPNRYNSYSDTELYSSGWLYLDRFTLDDSGRAVSASFFGDLYGRNHPHYVLSYILFSPFTISSHDLRSILAYSLSKRYEYQSNIINDIDAGVLFCSNFRDDGMVFVMLDRPTGRGSPHVYKTTILFIPSKITGFDALRELGESTELTLEFRDSNGSIVGSQTILPHEWTSIVDEYGKTLCLKYDKPLVYVYIPGKATRIDVRYRRHNK